MNIRKLFLLVAVLLGLGSAAFAQNQSTEATVTKVTGTATVKLPDGSSAAITQGMKLPQGAVITTAEASQVTIQAHDGIVAIANSKTTVAIEELHVGANGMRTAALGLRSGSLASSLDPAKKAVNNYAVRTPKGVAAARGTTYSVSYNGGTLSVTVVAGVVQSFTLNGVPLATTNAGGVSNTNDAGTTSQTLAQAIASEGAALGEALTTLASAVASVSGSAGTGGTDVAAVVSTIATAAGTSSAATAIVAQSTASAAAILAVYGDTQSAAAVVGAAVAASASAGNTAAAGTIVATATATAGLAVGNVQALANSFTQAATTAATNAGATVTIDAGAVAQVATQAIQSGAVSVELSAPVTVAEPALGGQTSTSTGVVPVVTTPQPIDPSTVSRSN
jgi:hypothetical protein